jgi:hypothetical protein
VAGWGPAEQSACAPAVEAMDAVFERAYLAAALEQPPPEHPPSWSRWIGQHQQRSQRFLDLTWQLLLPETPGIVRLIAGAPTPDLRPPANAESVERHDRELAVGGTAWAAGDPRLARTHFEAAARALPGSPRPALLAAACELRSGEPIGSLRSLLAAPASDPWVASLVSAVAPLLLEQVALSVRGDYSRAGEVGRVLLELTPGDLGSSGSGGGRPSPATATDVDLWLAWIHRNAHTLEVRDGRLRWRERAP